MSKSQEIILKVFASVLILVGTFCAVFGALYVGLAPRGYFF